MSRSINGSHSWKEISGFGLLCQKMTLLFGFMEKRSEIQGGEIDTRREKIHIFK